MDEAIALSSDTLTENRHTPTRGERSIQKPEWLDVICNSVGGNTKGEELLREYVSP